MICINLPHTNPFFNIASEEFFLKQFSEEICLLYANAPSVVIGKHQNAAAEVDMIYLKKKGIHLVRRLSGGGAVYHDLGNLNFSLIFNVSAGSKVNFKGYTRPIVAFLRSLGLDAHFGGHNSILVGTRKVSGNAEHIHRNRVLHHGTLLFSTHLGVLEQCLHTNRDRYADRAVRSVRAQVANISHLLPVPISIESFRGELLEFLLNFFNASMHHLTQADIEAINYLAVNRYSNPNWVLGYSPSYELPVHFETAHSSASFILRVEQGTIVKLVCSQPNELMDWLQGALVGLPHEPISITKAMSTLGVDGATVERVVHALF